MDRDQTTVLNAVVSGHNLVLTGQAGTGKTYTIKQCVNELKNAGKTVALTCYTGIACLQYKGMKPMTLHKFAGLEDGRHGNEHLLHLISSDERFFETKRRIMETEVLIIDEVSMVSKKILESVEYLCRKLRGGDNCFGGIQVVLCGDFFQLPPIKDELYGDSGHYCLQSHFFQRMFPHIMHLPTVHRQKEDRLIKCVTELEKGVPSVDTNEFIKSLTRPLHVDVHSQVVKLYARNLDVDLYNYQSLMSLDGILQTFVADDSGDDFYLTKLLAPKRLGIKISAPVMLLRNLNDRHVNGLTGKVVGIESDCIEVSFETNGKTEVVKITKCSFTKFDPVKNQCIARRQQYPLRLAYGMTIHKSQGMSLPFVEIDCNHANSPGQIGVAVGRAETSGGLRVLNYKPTLCKTHPRQVNEFYESSHGIGVLQNDLKCCRNYLCEQGLLPTVLTCADTDSEIEDLDENMEQVLNELEGEHSYTKRPVIGDTDVQTIFKKAYNDFIGTPSEQDMHKALTTMLNKEVLVTSWYIDQCSQIEQIFEQCCSAAPGSMKQKHFTDFYTQFNAYLSSKEYTEKSKTLTINPCSQQLLTTVMFLIQSRILKTKAQTVQTPEDTNLTIFPPVECRVSDAGRGKVRYIGGYCIAKCRYRLCVTMRKSLYVPGMESEINKFQQLIQILDEMTVSSSELMSSTQYQETLEETSRKQNTAEGLTNITDSVFEFFEVLESNTRSFMNISTLAQERKNLYRYVLKQLMSNADLFESFISKCYSFETAGNVAEAENTTEAIDLASSSSEGPVASMSSESGAKADITAETEMCHEQTETRSKLIFIFEKIVHLFLSVSVSQFRKDYLRALKREKGKALRKKVLEKSSKKSSSEAVSMKFIENDKSENKSVSHLKLKASALQTDNFYTDFKKQELMKILKAYGKTAFMKSTKKDMGLKLLGVLTDESCLKMTSPQTLHAIEGNQATGRRPPHTGEPTASTSVESVTSVANLTSSTPVESIFPSSVRTSIAPVASRSIESTTSASAEVHVATRSFEPIASTSAEVFVPTTPFEPIASTSGVVTISTLRSPAKRTASMSEVTPVSQPSKRKAISTKKGKGKGRKTQSKGKGKQLKKYARKECEATDDTNEACGVCVKFYKEGEDWICCDACSLWYHRECAGLEDDEDWMHSSNPDAVYICPMCL